MNKPGLRIVQVLPALESGGVERGTLELARYLVDKGHQSIVISAGGRLVDQLIRQGSKHIQWSIGRKSLFTFRLVFRLRRFLQEQEIDILHVRSRFPAWICYLAWKGMDPATRPKLVTTVHGPYSVSRYSSVMMKGEHVIVVSDMIRDYVLKNYTVNPEKVHRIYRGVSSSKFPFGFTPSDKWLSEWYQDYPQTKETFIITLPARITRRKGQQDFIELLALLKSQSVEVLGLVVGEAKKGKTAFLDELKKLAEEKQVSDRLCFVGHRSDLREVMAISDIVLSMSREPEAFGRITIEALSLGVPVIAYAHGGVEEQLTAVFPQGRVDVGNIEQAADRVISWIKQPPVVPNEHPFKLQNMLEQTIDVYLKP